MSIRHEIPRFGDLREQHADDITLMMMGNKKKRNSFMKVKVYIDAETI